ncbi:MAG: homoserine dehydrogenase [Desulfocapsaceae bacterium]|nr:homoserine dehydrogenase [Desulfocapsaceae bacterium]
MKKIHIGLIGFGTVGQGIARALLEQKSRIIERTGAEIVLSRVADINLEGLPKEFSSTTFSKDANDIITDPEIDIVAELIGGIEPAKTFLIQSIYNKKHVVTANKALLSTHGKEIFEAAVANNVEVGFEASVGGGMPVIKSLKEGLVANKIKSIRGIMNGTANYILTQMTEHGFAFEEVLRDAQEKGFAEADPTYDVEGVDTAHKLAILMSIAYGKMVHLDDISTEGISKIHPIDIDFAKEFGCRIKLLAISHNHDNHVEARVHPTMVPESHMLANIHGAFNAIQFTGDTVGDVLLYGQGAGMMPTGSAVAADIIDIGRNILADSVNRVPALSYLPENISAPTITPMGDLQCPYYFRITAVDKPGVLAKITSIFGKHNISIKSVIQRGRSVNEPVFIVLRSHTAKESSVQQAIAEIDALDVCTDDTVTIRVLIEEQNGN